MLSDISALRYDYHYEYKKFYHHTTSRISNDFYVKAYVSFDDWNYIPKEKFEWIEEWHGGQDRSYLIGVIHFEKLIDDKWWKEHGISLILTPEPIIENIEIRNLKKRSLELAGII